MLSKNNRLKGAQRQEKYALRKLSVGVASVLISTTVYLGVTSGTALADTNNNPANSPVSASLSTTNSQQQVSNSTPLAASNTVTLNQQAADDNLPQASAEKPSSSETTPQATDNANGLITQDAVHDVQITTKNENPNNKNKQAGSVSMDLTIKLSPEKAKQLKEGSYFDIRLGLPYQVNGNGQLAYLSYGNVNNNDTAAVLRILKDNQLIEIGTIVPMNSDNSYLGTRTDADNADGTGYTSQIAN